MIAGFARKRPARHNSRISPAKPKRPRPQAAPEGRTDGRVGRIVRLLNDNATVVVSGTKIADEIGTSRSAVWRLMEQLREMGVAIAGHPATGYRLERVPDLLLPEMLAPQLKGTIFAGHLHHYFRVDSTNRAAMEAAAAGEPEGSVFLAEEQTRGRGRGGHDWHSEPGTGIYCSVLLRPALPPADALALSLAAGLAVQEAVRSVTATQPDLRWPNDLLIEDKKVCGILTELQAEATRVRHAVVGVGLNVNQLRFPGALEHTATSLRLAGGREWSRVELAVALLQSLDRWYRTLLREGAAAVVRSFEAGSSWVRGKQVRVEEGGYEGVTEGLDERGFLRVRSGNGVRTVVSGGVRSV